MSDPAAIVGTVLAIIAECVGCEVDEVADEQNFFDDLGGESIDLLDLSFHVEKRLGLRINFHQMTKDADWAFDESGCLSEQTVRRFQQEFPGLSLDDLGVTAGASIRELLTVGFIIALVTARPDQSHRAAG